MIALHLPVAHLFSSLPKRKLDPRCTWKRVGSRGSFILDVSTRGYTGALLDRFCQREMMVQMMIYITWVRLLSLEAQIDIPRCLLQRGNRDGAVFFQETMCDLEFQCQYWLHIFSFRFSFIFFFLFLSWVSHFNYCPSMWTFVVSLCTVSIHNTPCGSMN